MNNIQWKFGYSPREVEAELAKKRRGMEPFKEGVRTRVENAIHAPGSFSASPGVRISSASSKKR